MDARKEERKGPSGKIRAKLRKSALTMFWLADFRWPISSEIYFFRLIVTLPVCIHPEP